MVLAGCVFSVVCYIAWEKSAKAKGLLKALYESQQLKNDLAARENERQQEFEFLVSQSGSLLQDLVEQIYSNKIIVEGVGFDYREDLAAIVQVFKNTPINYLSNTIGDFDLDVDEDEFNGLKIIKDKAPHLCSLRYLELIVIVRIMISQKVDLKNAAAIWESNT